MGVIGSTTPTIRPETIEHADTGVGAGGWLVTVFDNSYNTWDEVMTVLQLATGCDPEEAYIETWEIDNLGSSVVHHGGKPECVEAALIISTIGIKVDVSEG